MTLSDPNSVVFNNLAAGEYEVLVTDAAGCTALSSTEVEEPSCIEAAWYADADGDGFGDPAESISACDQPDGYVSNDEDCDDSDETVNPDATEVCNEIDDDCDGFVDDADSDVEGLNVWYADADEDGYGNSLDSLLACNQPSGYIANNEDCNDADENIHPGALEVCNSIDDDCDGLFDDYDPDATGGTTWYADSDNDGYGDPQDTVVACLQPDGYVLNDEDCDDSEETVHPGAEEVCDGIDNNCFDGIDEGLDTDGDGTADCFDECPSDPAKVVSGTCGCGNPEPGSSCDDGDANTINDVITSECACVGEEVNCEDGIQNGEEQGIDCGGPFCQPCTAPDAECSTIIVHVNPSAPVYNGPGNQDVWWIEAMDLDGGSFSFSESPEFEVKRYLSNITFDWTTNGACIDVTKNTVVNNPDKGTVWKSCLPVIPGDFNKYKFYKLRILDEFGEDECSGLVKVIPDLIGGLSSPDVVHIVQTGLTEPQVATMSEDLPITIEETEFILAPNPGKDILRISWTGSGEDLTIRVFDASGKFITEQELQSIAGANELLVDMSDRPYGVYLVSIRSGVSVKTFMWVKVEC
jgi:hypothetical protein